MFFSSVRAGDIMNGHDSELPGYWYVRGDRRAPYVAIGEPRTWRAERPVRGERRAPEDYVTQSARFNELGHIYFVC